MTGETMTRRDRMIPWYFVMFFAVFMIVDGVMAFLAIRTQSGVVTEHAYEKGLAYNKVVGAADAQAALGWQGEISVATDAEHGTQLALHVKDKAGKALTVESGKLSITRPTQAGLDFDVTLDHGKATVSFPRSGQWEVRAFATVAGKPYQVAKRIVIE